jgi:diguanylate cyclase (GGDEF)-like protein/PAS domain S-box-containing protein
MKKDATEDALHISNERLQAAINAVEGIIWICDSTARFVDKQPQWEDLTGQTYEQYIGYGWTHAVHPNNIDAFMRATQESLAHETPLEAEQILMCKDGRYHNFLVRAHPVRNPDGTMREWVGVHIDVTTKLQNENRIQHMATHDLLTNLPNRVLLGDRLEHLINQRAIKQHAILFMDLNRFKIINDSLGHDVGDQVLVEVAKRLAKNVRPGDTLARQGGDEFVIILEDVKSDSDVVNTTLKLLNVLSQPLNIADHEFTLHASIGIAVYPRDGESSQILLKHADLAMYLAKKAGGNIFKFFDKSINVLFEERLAFENDLKKAIRKNELFLNYQPKVNTRKSCVYCLEALVRWNHPTRGIVLPSEFISIAEEIGLISAIGNWVLKEACTQLKIWQSMGHTSFNIAINLSIQQLNSATFLSDIKTIMRETGTDPSKIEFEITETRLMENIHLHEHLLQELRNCGFSLAIDDFGTGYSSLSYLKRLPIKTLKIDRSFIMDIEDDTDDAAIISATISMANKMALAIVAEGVETREQAQFLKKQSCYCMQGNYFSKPLLSEEVNDFIRNF